MAELAFREDDAPFSGLGFPYAGFEAAIGALKQVGRCLGGIAGQPAGGSAAAPGADLGS
jgi:hypothetical protein